MDLNSAASICHPGPQDRTLALADELIGEVNQRNAKLEAEAAISHEYRYSACELERIAINLRAYCRGMIGKQAVPSYIKQAREALDAMEAAVTL